MKRKLFITGAGLALVVLIAATAGVPLFNRGVVPLEAQGYPPPIPSATVTPSPDGQGFLPAPDCVTVSVTSLVQSPYSDMLVPLQTALNAGDASAIAALAEDQTYPSLMLGDFDSLGGEGGRALNGQNAEALLADFFLGGSSPVVQGYLQTTSDEGYVRLAVLVHGWQGGVAYPTLEPSTFEYGPETPTTIDADAMTFEFLRLASGSWRWERWLFGDYYRMASAHCVTGPWLSDDFFLIRP